MTRHHSLGVSDFLTPTYLSYTHTYTPCGMCPTIRPLSLLVAMVTLTSYRRLWLVMTVCVCVCALHL